MAKAKSVSKLLLAARASYWSLNCCHMVFYVRFRANLCLQFSIGMAWGVPLFELDSNKHRGSKLRLLFKSFPGPLLKSGVGPLSRYGNHQEIISRRLEQVYTSSDTRLE